MMLIHCVIQKMVTITDLFLQLRMIYLCFRSLMITFYVNSKCQKTYNFLFHNCVKKVELRPFTLHNLDSGNVLLNIYVD